MYSSARNYYNTNESSLGCDTFYAHIRVENNKLVKTLSDISVLGWLKLNEACNW